VIFNAEQIGGLLYDSLLLDWTYSIVDIT